VFERIEFTNFRKFQRFSLRLRAGNILVGPNNAGKSSILDAFRALEACLRHARTRNPTVLDISGRGFFDGYEVPESVFPFSLANATYNYSDEDASIEFYQNANSCAVILLNPQRITRFFINNGGARLPTSSRFRGAFPADLIIVPTLSPLEADEPYVQDQTVQRNATTRLASRVLRNIWLRKSNTEFDAFKAEIEAAWPPILIQKPEMRGGYPPIVDMFYQEGPRIDREVQWAGFGFQVWMQILTHLLRGNQHSTLIIDEPDIYLHPDLQHKLLRMVRERFRQFILATHSVEIINDAEPHEIVSVSATSHQGRRIRTEEQYAALYRYLGSSDNADLARIARARKVIFVEGKDGRLLRRLSARMNLERLANPQNVPIIRLGGFSEWRRAVHAVWAFRQILDLEIEAFCVFDRDYRSEEEIKEFLGNVKDENCICRVLDRKEIENYLLEPNALQRAVGRRLRARDRESAELPIAEIERFLDAASADFEVMVMSQQAARCLQYAKEHGSSLDPSTIIASAAGTFTETWRNLPNRLRVAPGKEILSKLNELLQEKHGISLTDAMIAEHLLPEHLGTHFMGILRDMDAFCKT